MGWMEYDIFEKFPALACKTYLRRGGFSKEMFASLNLSDEVGDHLDSVNANRGLVKRDLQVKNLIFAKQKHQDVLMEVTSDNLDRSKECDGLYTREKNIALAITHADCQAAVFYSPEKNVIAAVHAGWRGQVKNIYRKTVRTLQEKCGVLPHELFVCISPSLCPEHAEFKNYQEELPESFWSFKNKDRPLFNLWKIALFQLARAGVREDRVEIAQSCTFCEEKDFFSHRRDKKTGRHATVAVLR